MPRIVTRPGIDSIASGTRPSWRNVVALRHWRRHAKTVIMSGMGGGSLCRILGWGIHSLHVAQPPCLLSVLAKVLEMPDPIFIAQAIDQMAQLGRINHAVNPV